ncbi:DUF551 domain-containing protein [Salmonella enterica]|uniref:DUF551 domain-containing protein n=1 Tax=Salmonella enterica TaxID=28901 RepID=UPI0020CA81F3|nr:DUF551 domain-containing protein [Salmonella enterica]
MKENQIRELVNDLRDIAVEYHGTQQLRERIARTVRAAWHHDLEKPNQPVSQTYELPQTQFEQVADLYEMQFDDGRTCAFHTDGTKAAQWLLACDGNKVQEYVRIERYQEAVIGNSPVQSPIDHGYRPECECSGCKATARICAELNNEEAEIFADGYNAAMQSFGNYERLNQAPVKQLSSDDVIGWLRSDYNSDDKRDPDAPLFMLGSNNPSETWGVKYMPLTGNSPVTPDGWISCSERMPDSKTGVLVAKEFDRKGDWRMKWATYIPGHPDANDGWIIPGASWIPSHWMPLPEPPQEEK